MKGFSAEGIADKVKKEEHEEGYEYGDYYEAYLLPPTGKRGKGVGAVGTAVGKLCSGGGGGDAGDGSGWVDVFGDVVVVGCIEGVGLMGGGGRGSGRSVAACFTADRNGENNQ